MLFHRVACVLAAVALMATVGCSSPSAGADDGRLQVVASVAPLVDIVKNVAGDAADVNGLIPEGVDSHTFEPTPDTAKLISDADVIVLNGLDLEDPTLELAQSDKKDSAHIFLLGDHTLQPSQYLYDFSFPTDQGHPNPHLWMDVVYAMKYTELVRDELSAVDPANAATYKKNADAYLETLRALDSAVQDAVDTVPLAHRLLPPYRASFAYFANQYGMKVIGAIQPADFAEPSAQEVAALI